MTKSEKIKQLREEIQIKAKLVEELYNDLKTKAKELEKEEKQLLENTMESIDEI
jgi:hypothetical protein